MTNSTINRTKTFCIRIVDFRASRGFKFQNFPGLRPCPIGGLTAPPKPPAAYSLASLGRFASLRSDISVGKYPLLTRFYLYRFYPSVEMSWPRPWLAPLLEVYARWEISSQSDPALLSFRTGRKLAHLGHLLRKNFPKHSEKWLFWVIFPYKRLKTGTYVAFSRSHISETIWDFSIL